MDIMRLIRFLLVIGKVVLDAFVCLALDDLCTVIFSLIFDSVKL